MQRHFSHHGSGMDYNGYSSHSGHNGHNGLDGGGRVATPPGLTGGNAGYMERLIAFRQNDVDRDTMIQELIQHRESLEKKYQNVLDDYNNEKESRRMWQLKANRLYTDLTTIRQTTESNPFVYAIIDGDGAIFDDELLAKGAEGGAEAAYLLQRQLKMYIKDTYPETNIEDWSIVVQVILNLEGLAKKLHASGIVPYTAEKPTLASFARAFGRSQPLFSFVDVGAGKESADHKIREMLRLMIRVSQCKHIFFGPCHDNGYLPVLEPYKHDASLASRISLFKTTPPEPGFLQLGLRITRFAGIFRSEPLPSRTGVHHQPHNLNHHGSFQQQQTTTLPIHSPPKPNPPTPGSTNSGLAVPPPKIATAAAATVLTNPSVASSTAASGTSSGSWSTVSKTTSGGVRTMDMGGSMKKRAARKYYFLNADSERVDEPLPRAEPIAEKKFKETMAEHGNFCNSFYLLGGCDNRAACSYYHGDSKLAPALLLVLKHKVRGIMCPQQSYCTNPDCIYGHHCKWTPDCTYTSCRFSQSHDMDTKPRLRVLEDGSIQSLTEKN